MGAQAVAQAVVQAAVQAVAAPAAALVAAPVAAVAPAAVPAAVPAAAPVAAPAAALAVVAPVAVVPAAAPAVVAAALVVVPAAAAPEVAPAAALVAAAVPVLQLSLHHHLPAQMSLFLHLILLHQAQAQVWNVCVRIWHHLHHQAHSHSVVPTLKVSCLSFQANLNHLQAQAALCHSVAQPLKDLYLLLVAIHHLHPHP